MQGHDRNVGLVEALWPSPHIVQGGWEDWSHHDLIEKGGDVGAGGGGVETVNNECTFVVGGDALGNDAGIIVEEGGGILAEVTGGLEEVMVLVTKTDVVVLIVETEAMNVGNESRVVDAEEDDVDKMTGGVVRFKDVDFVVVHIWGMARDGGGGPQGLSEDRRLRAHSATSENDGLFGVREEGEPGCYD